jgi:hypothetical protein
MRTCVRVHEPDTIRTALELAASGVSNKRIARDLGLSRDTVRRWRCGDVPGQTPRIAGRGSAPALDHLGANAYAHLLGLYLGDGCISELARTCRLRIVLDARYPGIVASAARSMRAVRPDGVVSLVSAPGCIVVSSYWRAWPAVFPQHGPGRKHKRRIELAEWQLEFTHTAPEALIRGLIESDGSRYVANQRVGGKVYARYEFSNRSEDIKRIFCDHLGLLGIGWTRPNAMSIAIARRADVEAPDRFVGPKR